MLRVYIWDPVGTPMDPAAWGDMVVDLGEQVVQVGNSAYEYVSGDTGGRPAGTAASRILPDVYGDDAPQRWGHAGIGFRDVVVGDRSIVAYRAFWPRDPAAWPLLMPEQGTVYTSLDDDMRSEGGAANHVMTIPDHWPLDQAAVWAQWEAWRATPPGYAAMGFNCCASVARSIFENLRTGEVPIDAAYYLANNPEPGTPITLQNWLRNLQSMLRER